MTTESNPQLPSLERLQSTTLSRRKLIFTTGTAVFGAALLAACGSDANNSSVGTASSGTTPDATTGSTAAPGTTAGEQSPATTDGGATGDLAIAQLAAGLEVLAVSTYQSAAEAAGSGALGEVPPAVGEYVATALAHHQAHLDAWNKVITAAGSAEVTEPNADLAPVVAEQFAGVTDVIGAAKLALELEMVASHTYLTAIPLLEAPEAIELAGSIQIVDQQHQSILLFVLGEYPVPDVFQKTDKSAA